MRVSLRLCEGKNRSLPGSRVQKKATAAQIVSIAVVGGIPHQVRQPPSGLPEILERQPHVALALVRGIVHRYQEAILASDMPGESQETVRGPVLLPGGNAFKQLPLSLTKSRDVEEPKDPTVELGQLLVN